MRSVLLLICTVWSFAASAAASYDKPYSNEFFVAGGYSHCRMNFIDAGLRYYRWRNDGQTFLAFSGVTTGCEFSLKQPQQVYVPYLGWQGQALMLAYGLRAEYATDRELQSFGVMPELGFSAFEFLRITAGYRWIITNNDPLQMQGFRFSVVGAFPVSFLWGDDE